jgi:hypothetical protein
MGGTRTLADNLPRTVVDRPGDTLVETCVGSGGLHRRHDGAGSASGATSGAISGAVSGAISGAISAVLGLPVQLVVTCATDADARATFANFEVFRRWVRKGGDDEVPNVVVRMILKEADLMLDEVPRRIDSPADCEVRCEGGVIVLPPMKRRVRKLWKRILRACGEGEVSERAVPGAAASAVGTSTMQVVLVAGFVGALAAGATTALILLR